MSIRCASARSKPFLGDWDRMSKFCCLLRTTRRNMFSSLSSRHRAVVVKTRVPKVLDRAIVAKSTIASSLFEKHLERFGLHEECTHLYASANGRTLIDHGTNEIPLTEENVGRYFQESWLFSGRCKR